MVRVRAFTTAMMVTAAVLAGCGTSGPHYTYWNNPCVKSRIANGDWRQQDMAYGIPLEGAAMFCSYGASFDSVNADAAYGAGPNTSGWDWHGEIPGVPTTSQSAPVQAKVSASPTVPPRTAAQRDCGAAVQAFNKVAGPLVHNSAPGVVAAGEASVSRVSALGHELNLPQYPAVADAVGTLLWDIGAVGDEALNYEHHRQPWSDISAREPQLASDFRSVDSACTALGITIDGGGQATVPPTQSPVPTPATDPAACPISGQLLAAWNAAPASARTSWTALQPTGFDSIECWHQWVVTEPIMNANGLVVFGNTAGKLTLLPSTKLPEFSASVCGAKGAPADWSGAAGPATC